VSQAKPRGRGTDPRVVRKPACEQRRTQTAYCGSSIPLVPLPLGVIAHWRYIFVTARYLLADTPRLDSAHPSPKPRVVSPTRPEEAEEGNPRWLK